MPPEKAEQNNPPAAEPSSVPQTPPAENKNPLHSLRTYQGDIEEIMEKNKTSISSIVVAEQKRKEVILDLPKEAARSNTRNKFFIILGFLFLAVGVGVNLWVYLSRPSTEAIVQQKSKT